MRTMSSSPTRGGFSIVFGKLDVIARRMGARFWLFMPHPGAIQAQFEHLSTVDIGDSLVDYDARTSCAFWLERRGSVKEYFT